MHEKISTIFLIISGLIFIIFIKYQRTKNLKLKNILLSKFKTIYGKVSTIIAKKHILEQKDYYKRILTAVILIYKRIKTENKLLIEDNNRVKNNYHQLLFKFKKKLKYKRKYFNLKNKYKKLESDNNTLLNNYNTVVQNKIILQNQYNLLQYNYTNLNVLYNNLSNEKLLLQQEYDILSENYDNLEYNYNQLYADYIELQEIIDSLINTENQLSIRARVTINLNDILNNNNL